MKIPVIILAGVVAAGLSASLFLEKRGECVEVKVEIADTPEARQLGLSGREVLDENEGMLFIHETPGSYGYWMKDMNFPLDIVWLGEDMKIIGAMENVLPESYPEAFYPPQPVRYALEVNAGWVKKNNIQTGNKICR
ncbi:hypothetical protein A3A20_02330 [Candidatus Wolfebacteria bacterium RIFCSPLOWO2_01_FULL_45_19]|uniref:DUF192 domain-containing protein n=1 Tax=Candidatus Wolfebacteria bacterium RIFCSPLOWO2_01_FULL_45_19 TaxID=1802557 RepID=A0A1F8DV73_9BACT|nr:MAG: hypothetical protein UX23_C0001G0105 [Parcubacteria group bacterium GW2011_GWB1_45_9]OGM91748.1 MAG: hypothetical protein A3A20_02330 [Candidatus Wolfebacteria bacterium RIFCSPLOWO2_01_FULL_45_19]